MIKLIYIMGKSSTGKDTVKGQLLDVLNRNNHNVQEIVLYTTRPKRVNEIEGVDYYFVTEKEYKAMEEKNIIIESRTYEKIQGRVRYFTVLDKKNISPATDFLISIGTLESYKEILEYLRLEDTIEVIPVYIEVDNRTRLERAIKREEGEPKETQNFQEIQRRFDADEKDFSEDKLLELNLERRFNNDKVENTIKDIYTYLSTK